MGSPDNDGWSTTLLLGSAKVRKNPHGHFASPAPWRVGQGGHGGADPQRGKMGCTSSQTEKSASANVLPGMKTPPLAAPPISSPPPGV